MQWPGKSLAKQGVACSTHILGPLLPSPLVQWLPSGPPSQGLSVAETSAPVDPYMEMSSGGIPYRVPRNTRNQEEPRGSNGPTTSPHTRVFTSSSTPSLHSCLKQLNFKIMLASRCFFSEIVL